MIMLFLLKVLIIIGIVLVMAYPLIPAQGKLKNLFPASKLRYDFPHNRKNFPFIILAFLEFAIVEIIFGLFDELAAYVKGLPFIGSLFTDVLALFSSQVDFIFFTIKFILVNAILLYAYISAKSFLKVILDRFFGINGKKRDKKKNKDKKKHEKDKNEQENDKKEDSENKDEKKEKDKRVPFFVHSDEKEEEDKNGDPSEKDGIDNQDASDEEKEIEKNDGETESKYGPIASFIYGIFFEGEDFETARPWVIRVTSILQCFIILVECIYLIFMVTVLVSDFFPLPLEVYTFLIETFRIKQWYLYPILSVVFLQEICNTFKTPSFSKVGDYNKDKKDNDKEDRKLEARLRRLLSKLKHHFDSEHSLRYYPEAIQTEVKEYEPKNLEYQSALRFIRDHMKTQSGHVVQSYMKCLDASFSDNHVYFASSFYSELGSYLIDYTYIRLLSGARMIYVVSNPDEIVPLCNFLSERLMALTNSSETNSWRVYTADERLDQADVLVACPNDFRNINIVAQYPKFFEEVSNAIFLDADRMISLDSYLCPVMGTHLMKATENRIRFIFLTQDLYKGFAARSLPKFFGVEPVLTFSSAAENESVSYVLWNRESKSHRIYNKNGQKTTCLEHMIADLACQHDIDGVRILTESPLDHAEHKTLLNSGVEINKFTKDAVDVNYMIYSDERCNLSASIYACTRFRGQKKSVVHIISKPYLLREYFIAKAATENFVNRSSFIQPRVPEHIDEHKLSLLRLFCDLVSSEGVLVTTFENRIREIIKVSCECGYMIQSAFCRKMLESKAIDELSTTELAAYLIAGLYDTDLGDAATSDEAAAESYGHRAKEFHLIYAPDKYDSYNTKREKYIVFNRESEVFDRLHACNDRVALCLNDVIIGYEDTFPTRTHLEYVAGQSIFFQNSEYEIEHISDDGRIIYLRSENVKLSHCLDTIQLRRYTVDSITPIPKRTGVLNNTKLTLEEIRVTECTASFTGETYGFYGLSSDRQTLDFYHKDGVDGNSHFTHPHVRKITDGRILKVELQSRMVCTDGMRLLMSAVFNEFIRTIFPKTHHAISIVPILEAPLPFDHDVEPKNETECIQALYPYLQHPSQEFIETDPNRITFLFINDCLEDIGAFQWFYDLSGRYMQEFLANIYSYLYWLKQRPNLEHYIYFGGESLPECFDLDGCCELLEGYNRILAELDGRDIETAGNNEDIEAFERCAFCHLETETGRYSLFDKNRYICADCFEIVDNSELLEELHSKVREYLKSKYPKLSIGTSKVALDPVYELNADQVFSEFYYRVDLTERIIFTERDDPMDNVWVSLLRGLIELWQSDNELINEYSKAQLYYEELLYLRDRKLNESADWIYCNLDGDTVSKIEEIALFTGISAAPVPTETNLTENSDAAIENLANDNTNDVADEVDNGVKDENTDTVTDDSSDSITDDKTGSEDEEVVDDVDTTDEENEIAATEPLTSFDFMRSKRNTADDNNDDGEYFFDDEHDGLYNPNKIPRFWKRYLRNQTADNGMDEDTTDAENNSDDNVSDTPNAEDDTNENGTPETNESESEENNDFVSDDSSNKKRFSWFRRVSPGEKICPVEEDEQTNPLIRVYNEMVRHAYNYSEEPFDRSGVTDKDIERIFYCVRGDYPELFWLYGWSWTNSTCSLTFRCKDANGHFDEKQVNRKRKELKKAAKTFTKGISRRTDPYEALLTIYRRLILLTDYDSVGLANGISNNLTRDDPLRSLHSALVEHKVVCAGYAIAMLYLMQSIGIVSANVISEIDAEGNCHAFNILKLGKFCYYLDATWGDPSNTLTESKDSERINYEYVCVPFNEFIQTAPEQITMHYPNKTFYTDLETFQYSNHEYFRYHKAYLEVYKETEIERIIADAAKAYKPKEMGEFAVGIRFRTPTDARVAFEKLLSNRNLSRLIERAKSTLDKKKQIALLEGTPSIWSTHSGVIYIRFENKQS